MYEDQSQIQEELLVEQPTEFNQLPLNHDEWTSIYIPVLSDKLLLMNHNDVVHKFQPKYLRDFLEKILRIGKIRRIDFVDRDIPNSTTPVKSAFVHFEYWYDTTSATNLRNKLESYGQYRQKGYIYKGKRCNFYLQNEGTQSSKPAYFDIRVNHKPIQETECDRNVHQLYAENLLLEKELSENKVIINNLSLELEHYRQHYGNPQANNSFFQSITKPQLRRTESHVPGTFGETNTQNHEVMVKPLTLQDLATNFADMSTNTDVELEPIDNN